MRRAQWSRSARLVGEGFASVMRCLTSSDNAIPTPCTNKHSPSGREILPPGSRVVATPSRCTERDFRPHPGSPKARPGRTARRRGQRLGDLLEAARLLHTQGAAAGAEVAVWAVVPLFPQRAEDVLEVLAAVAEHPLWGPRESAAAAAGALLTKHFDVMLPVLRHSA